MMGFRTRILLGVVAAVLFSEKIKAEQGLVSGNGPIGTSNDSSKDWQNFILHISGSTGETGTCVECVLCSDCFSGCDNITSLEDDGNAINCSTDEYGQNTDNYWICACDILSRLEVNIQIMSLATTCSLSTAGIDAINTFSNFCNFIGTATTSASVPVTVAGQSSAATTSVFSTASPGTRESSTVHPTTSPSNSNIGLSSATSSAIPSSSSKSGLGTGAKVGIAVGSVVGALLILVALWMILASRGKERLKESQPEGFKESQAEEPVTPNEDSTKPEAVQENKSAPRPARVEEFNPYPGPSDS